MAPIRGERAVQRFNRRRRECGEFAAFVDQVICREHAGAAAVRQDREPVAGQTRAALECFECAEQIVDLQHAEQTCAAKRCVVNRVGACERAGVRAGGARAFRVAAGLDHDHGFDARATAGGRHEFAGVGDALDVEQHGACGGVGGQEVQHVAEIDVAHPAHRDQVREADPARDRPVDHRRQHCARLGHERGAAGGRHTVRETRVQLVRGRQHADAVRANDAEHVRPGLLKHALLRGAARLTHFGETGGQDDDGFHAARAEFADEIGDRRRRRRDDGELGRARKCRYRLVDLAPQKFAAVRIDEHDLARETALDQIARDDTADRGWRAACADQRDACRLEERIQIANGHLGSPAPHAAQAFGAPASITTGGLRQLDPGQKHLPGRDSIPICRAEAASRAP